MSNSPLGNAPKDIDVTDEVIQDLFVCALKDHPRDPVAAVRALWPGLTPQQVWRVAGDLLEQPHVAATYSALVDARPTRPRLSVAQIEQSIAELCDYDPIDLFDEDGNLKPFAQLSPVARRAIQEFEHRVADGGPDHRGELVHVTKVKLVKRLDALALLARVRKMFGEDSVTDRPASLTVNILSAKAGPNGEG